MKYILLGLPAFILFSCQSNVPTAADSPPNLILIIADDMAWDDCGAYGHPNIRTPNIDRLAKEGMRFTQAFLTTSSCSPSRASIITGTYPHQTDAEQLHWPLPGDRVTFVEQLKANGYWTAAAGKWHLGDAIRDRFDYIAAESTAGFVLQSGKENAQPKQTKNDGSGCQQWLPTLQKRPLDQPFFLWLAAVDPHRPYQENTIAQPHTDEEVILPPYLPDSEPVRNDFALYYDEIHRMDEYIGQILEELDQSALAENTVVLFISDNGRAFPREKTTLYDGGIKTPWLIRWPKKVKAGSVSDALVSSLDIAPTFLQLAELDAPPNFLGKDFSTVLQDTAAEINEYIFAEDHWHDFEDYGRAIRNQRYKLIHNYYPDLANTPPADALRSPTFQYMLEQQTTGGLTQAQQACFQAPRAEEELYDLQQDPYELHNRINDPNYADIAAELRKALQEFRTRTRDSLPTRRTPDEFTRDTGQPLPVRKRPRPSKQEMGLSK